MKKEFFDLRVKLDVQSDGEGIFWLHQGGQWGDGEQSIRIHADQLDSVIESLRSEQREYARLAKMNSKRASQRAGAGRRHPAKDRPQRREAAGK